ncbi:hypothetical protein V7S43_006536 [Phytophthora oleae]|uniref:Uncharacterized protein n=1 Tax=Phytophthora oleae TaxID=2107226 RepID=A0ABD3FPS4_9STRA
MNQDQDDAIEQGEMNQDNMLELDAFDRMELGRGIFVRRCQVPLREPIDGNHPEFIRTNLLYLIRLAPLTERNGEGELVLSAAGNFFAPLQGEDVRTLENQHVAKFGFTTQPCIERFKELLRGELQSKGFPDANWDLVYALAIEGPPHDYGLLNQMEHGLGNLLDRQRLRLDQHARGVLHSGNRTAMAETFEFVKTDLQGDHLFGLFQRYAERLEETRNQVRAVVQEQDNKRRRNIAAVRAAIRAQYRIRRQQLRQQDGAQLAEELQQLQDEMDAAKMRMEDTYVPVPVRYSYFTALQEAAATAD